MSLIHEALEKLEHEKKWKVKDPDSKTTLDQKVTTKAPPKENHIQIAYAIVSLLIFFFAVGIIYLFTHPIQLETPQPKTNSTSSSVQIVSGPLFPLGRGPFSLTGVTKIGSEWTAIINNQLVRKGDWIGGASVDEIQEDRVILNFKGRLLMLSLYGDRSTNTTRIGPPSQ